MINKLFSFLGKSRQADKKEETSVLAETQHKDSSVDIIISLTKKGEVDLSVFIDTSKEASKKNTFDYAQKCAEFLSVVSSSKLKNQIMSIILDQIRSPDNQILIENIVMFWALLDKEDQDKKEKINNKTYILPSEVFPKYVRN